MTRVEAFRREVRALSGIYGRMDSGVLTGRNSDATARAIETAYRRGKAILDEALRDPDDTLWTYLESPRGDRLFRAWERCERRFYGLYVPSVYYASGRRP